MSHPRPRKTAADYIRYVYGLTVLDDTLFEEYIKDPDACEELLQTVLENPDLRIRKDTLIPQKSIHIVGKRSVRVDAYVEGSENIVYNIEIQRSDNCNHVKRVRYNASALTVSSSEPGDRFEDVRNVIVIYISEFDIFNLGKTIYHVLNTISETGTIIDDGLTSVYVNTQNYDGSKVSELMYCFKQTDFDNTAFPKSSARIKELKHDKEQVEKMCKIMQDVVIRELIEDWMDDGKSESEIIKKLCSKYLMTEQDARTHLQQYILHSA